ncbi:hypothetical protein HPP92_024119 [Vanilla planifolia]|uniref:Uncharacterized protein n=1 Tax=Vanilla planifolia TaxID=51239 RepID=A0A835PQ51_VANPL|nr:hypothetical protein HPP92_024119 [Vanilla planifolia]
MRSLGSKDYSQLRTPPQSMFRRWFTRRSYGDGRLRRASSTSQNGKTMSKHRLVCCQPDDQWRGRFPVDEVMKSWSRVSGGRWDTARKLTSLLTEQSIGSGIEALE